MEQKRPLRILYILNASGGGATQGILELLRSLPREAYQAFLVVPDQPTERQRAIFSGLAQEYFRVPMIWWNLKVDLPWYWRVLVWARGWLKTLGHLLPLWQLCKIIREKEIDIVYTNTVMILDGALAARLCGIPHIWHIKEWIGSKARVKFFLPDWLLVKVIMGLSERVLVMTQFIGDIFYRYYNDQDKVSIIYDGVDLADFQSVGRGLALRASLGIPAACFLVGMSASLSARWKQHGLFIKMASLLSVRFPEMRFVIFGSTPCKYVNPAYNYPWNYYQTLIAQVKMSDLEGKFYWAGFCEGIPAMMDALDVLVHPCETEPFGRVAIEAMAAMRPVVGPRRGGIAESIVDRQTGLLVEPGDPQAFADAVASLFEQPQLRTALAGHGPARVARSFSIEQHVAQIGAVFQMTCQHKKKRAM
ncbi:MAG: glycosyltransferase family 4 protein [Anaerolineales bacterium]